MRNGIHGRRAGMTLVELLVVVAILAVLVLLFQPYTGPRVGTKGLQTKALYNAKQVGLALRLYAGDHNGLYPSQTLSGGKPTSALVPDSNTAFAQLFPTYVQSESIFWVPQSAWCNPNPPDEVTDPDGTDIPFKTLARGENEWAYVLNITDTSNPAVPLLASGFADPVRHTYTTNAHAPGGRWKGVNAVVVRADNSGAVMKVNPKTMTVSGTDSTLGVMDDIFTTGNSAKGWLQPGNVVVNPK